MLCCLERCSRDVLKVGEGSGGEGERKWGDGEGGWRWMAVKCECPKNVKYMHICSRQGVFEICILQLIPVARWSTR